MKFVMDEKVKHRLIGLAVIVSLGVIFIPSVLKNTDKPQDTNFSVHVKLPPKPVAPKVVVDEYEVFKTVKVAKVDVAKVNGAQKQEQQPITAARHTAATSTDTVSTNILASGTTKPQSSPVTIALNTATTATVKQIAKTSARAHNVQVAAAKKQAVVARVTPKAPAVKVNQRVQSKKDAYAVQLASFSQMQNAQSMVGRLKSKGYNARVVRVSSRTGAVYKVFVGNSARKGDVMQLKSQLATAMNLHGFVVNTGVS